MSGCCGMNNQLGSSSIRHTVEHDNVWVLFERSLQTLKYGHAAGQVWLVDSLQPVSGTGFDSGDIHHGRIYILQQAKERGGHTAVARSGDDHQAVRVG